MRRRFHIRYRWLWILPAVLVSGILVGLAFRLDRTPGQLAFWLDQPPEKVSAPGPTFRLHNPHGDRDRTVIRTAKEWEEFVIAHGGPGDHVPELDFERQMVVICQGMGGGNRVKDVARVERNGDDLIVGVRETRDERVGLVYTCEVKTWWTCVPVLKADSVAFVDEEPLLIRSTRLEKLQHDWEDWWFCATF